jgi:anti-sigma factor RsiW
MDLEGISKDILLFAYVDFELCLEQRPLVEDLLSRDPDAFQRVEEIRDLNRLLKAAYNEYGNEAT